MRSAAFSLTNAIQVTTRTMTITFVILECLLIKVLFKTKSLVMTELHGMCSEVLTIICQSVLTYVCIMYTGISNNRGKSVGSNICITS